MPNEPSCHVICKLDLPSQIVDSVPAGNKGAELQANASLPVIATGM